MNLISLIKGNVKLKFTFYFKEYVKSYENFKLLDTANGNQKTLRAYARYEALDFDISIYTYKCNFDVPEDFGEIGAVLVENEYSKKMFFKNIVLNNGVTFTCESWVHSKNDNPDKRIFFADKVDTNLIYFSI
ncbi:putative linoleate 13S-lipoxygenase [Helianthus annuus]|nr:putative linoleate 13S-lipoxygenase [Helianthus annuus]